jgi:hypothetical protein
MGFCKSFVVLRRVHTIRNQEVATVLFSKSACLLGEPLPNSLLMKITSKKKIPLFFARGGEI